MDRKVLIITYYWPPSSGSGVQRWLKFVKYLPGFGWTPVVVTPETPSFTIHDPTLAKDIPTETRVLRRPIREPGGLFFWVTRLTGSKNNQADVISTWKKSLFRRMASWIRGNLFIPDGRVLWVKPTAQFLDKVISDESIHVVVTTGPPHSMHLIGLALKKRHPELVWIADFRDPWSEWDLLDTFSLTSQSRKRHRELELEVLSKADRVITIAPHHVQRFTELGGRRVDLITNGFDPDDFSEMKKKRTARFCIVHVGIVDELRDPRPVIEAMSELASELPAFGKQVSLKFIGHVNSAFQKFVHTIPRVDRLTVFADQIPHKQLIEVYGESDLQLLVLAHTALAPGNLPGKFFEYLASGNPILAIGPVSGDAGEILRKTRAGEIFERTDIGGIKEFLKRSFELWQLGETASGRDLTSFTRKALTGELVKVLEAVIGDR